MSVSVSGFRLQAEICLQHYLDQESLQEECDEGGQPRRESIAKADMLSASGRKLGFDAKQMIHPAQVPVIQAAFSPSKAGELLFRFKASLLHTYFVRSD